MGPQRSSSASRAGNPGSSGRGRLAYDDVVKKRELDRTPRRGLAYDDVLEARSFDRTPRRGLAYDDTVAARRLDRL